MMGTFLAGLLSSWHQALALLPFAWTEYEFMRTALLAVLIVAPLFALVGTMVVNSRMAFFSDVLGHSALTGVAIGVLAGLAEPLWAMLALAALLALVFNLMKRRTGASSDTVLGVLFSATVAFGIVILSRKGEFGKFTAYLIGDILAVTPSYIGLLALLFVLVAIFWLAFGNRMLLVGLNPVLAKSRGVSPFWINLLFSLLLALLVTLAIRMVGLLIVSALLVLPAAAARNATRDVRGYTLLAVGISLVAGAVGLVASFYLDTASGATIVLVAALAYAATALAGARPRQAP
jgi:zinc transport system permease protein